MKKAHWQLLGLLWTTLVMPVLYIGLFIGLLLAIAPPLWVWWVLWGCVAANMVNQYLLYKYKSTPD